jgi:disulfide bond formation protein DsbB
VNDDLWINLFVLLTVAALVATLVLWTLAIAARFGVAADVWADLRATLGRSGLACAAIVATTAMLGSLYLSEGVDLLPCTLCWYQRIAMYALAIILVVAAVRGDWGVRPYALALGIAGPAVSLYHYAIERFPDLEVGGACDAFNPCSAVPLWRLHFVSIPFMALTAFLLVDTILLTARPERHVTEAS